MAQTRGAPGQLIQRYGIAVSECSIASPWRGPTAVDESALENVTDQGRTCGRDPLAVDIDGRGSSRLSGPHRHVATTKTSQRVAEARSTADDGGRIVMWPGCSTSHMAMWLHEDARRFARMDPHGVTARPPRGCDRWSTRAAGCALPADRRTPTYRAPGGASSRRQLDGARALRGHRVSGVDIDPCSSFDRATSACGHPRATQRTPRDRSAAAAESRAERDCA
jgi:hypothetical protein